MNDVSFILFSTLFLSAPIVLKYALAFKGRGLYVKLRQHERQIGGLITKLESIERETGAINRACSHVELQKRHAQMRCTIQREQLEKFQIGQRPAIFA